MKSRASSPAVPALTLVLALMLVLAPRGADGLALRPTQVHMARRSGLHFPSRLRKPLVRAAAVDGTANDPAEDRENSVLAGGSSGFIASYINLVKLIAGAGVLSLPAGVKAVSSDLRVAKLAVAMLVAAGTVTAYCFWNIGRLCELTGKATYRDAVTAAMNRRWGQVVAWSTTIKTFVASIMYSIVMADSFISLATTFGLPALFQQRTAALLGLTGSVLVPLCLLRSFSALKYTSFLGVIGTLFTAWFTGRRALDGSYLAPAGEYLASVPTHLQPAFSTAAPSMAGLFVLSSMLSTAFVAHYNAPKFWTELKGRSTKKFGALCAAAFGTTSVMFAVIMVAGFATFGGASSGFILNNYSPVDTLATVARVAILVTVLSGFPLTFSGLQGGVLELTGKQAASWKVKDRYTFGLLAAVTTLACFLRDLGFVASFGGALLGSAIIYIFPSLAFVAVTEKRIADGKQARTGALRAELIANKGLAVGGVALGIIGAVVSVLKSFTSVLG